jgi:hypothetical protein
MPRLAPVTKAMRRLNLSSAAVVAWGVARR